ncbi:MAG: DUF6082 family protein [Verrucomicrobiota bacterium]|jgi:hypothetical protein
MAGFLSWINGNFNVIQTIGIIGSLWTGILVSHREAKAKEADTLCTLAEQHRELWSEAIQKADLQRVLRPDADVGVKPATLAEEEFLNLVIVHWLKSWRIAKAGGIITAKELGVDAGKFFSLPLPRAIWEKTKKSRNPEFVRFVERAVERGGQLSAAGS